MAEPFVFRKVLYLTEATGLRARRLDELLRLVVLADTNSIGYHMHREFLAYKFAHAEYPNDFAYFAARVLGDEVLGERLANLRIIKHTTLLDLQRELALIIADHLNRHPESAAELAPQGREFNFCRVIKFVLVTGRTAHDLPSFMSAIAEVEASSLYFHLFETRYDGSSARGENDFARWARDGLVRPVLATRLSSFDPYMFSLEQARRVLLRILSEADAEVA